MKKSQVLFLALFLSIVFATSSFAQSVMLNYDGSEHDAVGRVYSLKVLNKQISTDVPAFIYDKYPMVPVRLVFEALGATVGWDNTTKATVIKYENKVIEFKVEDKTAKINNRQVALDVPVKTVSAGGYGRTMVPLSFFQLQLGLSAQCNSNTKLVTIDKSTATPVASVLPGYTPVSSVTQKPSPRPSPSVTPKPSPSIVPKPSPSPVVSSSPSPSPSPSPTPSPTPSMTPGPVENNPGMHKVNDVLHYVYGGKDQLVIMTDAKSDFTVTRLAGTNRIAIDFPDSRAEVEGEMTAKPGSIVKRYGLAQLNATTARVTIEVAGTPQFEFESMDDRVVFFFQPSNLKNITYQNDKDRTCFILSGAKLTEGGMTLKKLYTGKYDATGKIYTISFPSKQAALSSGVMSIYDKYLDAVEVINDAKTGQTSIMFYSKEKLSYNIITRPEVNNTAIAVLKPYTKADKLVVIDPGHGGVEPGAVYGGQYEKNLNLDIAIRLSRLLKAKNINTYIMREDDSFVGLYERAYIANTLNATLFLSIHNNALDNPNYGGTMTLYTQNNPYDTKLFGKRFANIIQQKLVQKLKTSDRSIINRPELVVLKATNMPSALAEVAFMTNKPDITNLMNGNFRQDAAQAMCDGIIQALGEVK